MIPQGGLQGRSFAGAKETQTMQMVLSALLQLRGAIIALLLSNPWLWLFLFVFGALPQFVKLYAIHGLLWIKAFATMYLVPMLFFEFLALLSVFDDLQQFDEPIYAIPYDELELTHLLSFGALLLHMLSSTWPIVAIAGTSTPWYLCVDSFLIVLICVVLIFAGERSHLVGLGVSIFFSLYIIAIALSYYICRWDSKGTVKPDWTKYLG